MSDASGMIETHLNIEGPRRRLSSSRGVANLSEQADMNDVTAILGDCKECGTPLVRKGAGPLPTYCSGRCRAKAGARRAKADGRTEKWVAAAAAKKQAAREANARPCPYCGDPMDHARRVQCGKPECKRLWTNQRNLAWQHQHKADTGQWYSKTFTYERLCETCGQSWRTTKKEARYCSASCTNRARAYKRVCERCANPFTSPQHRTRWCSTSCRTEAQCLAELERRKTAWLPVLPDWPEGRAWVNIPDGHPARAYIPGPRLFVQGRCIRCDEPFCVQSEVGIASYCSMRCQRGDSKARRRALKRNAYVAHVYRHRIFERDKWTCRLCGKKTKRDMVVPHPLAPVIDHIIPLAKGGTHEPANAQCAHFLCNSIKGDRGGGEQLALLG